ncbi:MAG: YfcE family phosphodiesterase [Euryarchaeota archaeon]|nr:YfcE family phosphodiesterase [Euryarchaeota archaeon]
MRNGSEVIIISDVHSNLFALEAVLSRIREGTTILHAGDVVGYYTFPNEVISLFKKWNIISIRGNHDRALINGNVFNFNEYAAASLNWTSRKISKDSLFYILKMKDTLRLNLMGKRVAVYHGAPWDNDYYLMEYEAREGIIPEGIDVLLLGHTHIPFIKKFGNRIILNPGSVGQPRDGDPRASFVRIRDNWDIVIERVEYDIDKVEESIKKEGLPEFLAKRLYGGY